jgi:hypothetical protein
MIANISFDYLHYRRGEVEWLDADNNHVSRLISPRDGDKVPSSA